jgi:hypothetical protein
MRNKEMPSMNVLPVKIRPQGKFTAKIYSSIHQLADGLQNRELLIIYGKDISLA